MEKNTLIILESLKKFIKNENLVFPEDTDWSELLSVANIHTVQNILAYMVMKNPAPHTAEIMPIMRRNCLGSISVYAHRAECMKFLIEKLNAADVDHLVFKGYVVRNYYPVPELRTFGDIDFLIRIEDREKVHQLMLDNGFEVKTDWEPVYSYVKSVEYYEIHTDVMEVDVSDKADYKGYFKDIWNHAHNVGGHTFELSPEFHFLYLLTHIAKHISGSGAGIRMYMDIAVFVQHFGDSIDWNYIVGELDKLQFRDFANMVLTVVEKYFEIKSPITLKEIPEEVVEDFMEYTMQGGIFGKSNRDSGVVALKKQDRNEETVSKTATLIRNLFPSASSLEKRYTYLQGRHWLLPVAWVHRVLRTREKWGQHVQQAQNIVNADTEEVLKLKRIYKEIGL